MGDTSPRRKTPAFESIGRKVEVDLPWIFMNGRRVEEIAAQAVAHYCTGDDSDGGLLEEACKVLAPAGGEALGAIAPFLVKTTADERAAAAALMIGRVGEANQDPVKREAHDLLMAVLPGEMDREVREAVATGLGLIWASEDVTSEAVTLVSHTNVNMRYAAAHFLGLTTSDDSALASELAALEVLKSDSDPDVRGWAEFGLETLVPWTETGCHSHPRP